MPRGASVAEIEYTDYKRMIQSTAWSFHRSTGIEFEELVSQGNLIFVHLLKTYDPKKAAFSTALHSHLRKELIIFTNPRKNPICESLDACNDKHSDTCQPDHHLEFNQALDKLSGTATIMVNLVLTSPTTTLKLKGTEKPKHVRGAIVKYMRKQGTTWTSIWSSMNEIKQMLEEV